MPRTQQDLFKLTKAVDAARSNYQQMNDQAQELRVMQASKIGNVRVIDSALAFTTPIAPNRPRLLAFWSILSLMIGASVLLMQGWWTSRIVQGTDLEAAGFSIFSIIPFTPKAKMQQPGRQKTILSLTDPDDIVVEAFRSLRTSLRFTLLNEKSKAVLITSATPNVGKTFCAENLAVVSALAGQNVCLIDADLRRGTIHERFGVRRSHKGLASYLSGDATLDEILVRGPIDGLYMIPTGPLPPNPSELLMRDQLTTLLSELEGFDLTILDSPPILNVTDAVIIGRLVGSTLCVVRQGITSKPEMIALMAKLSAAGITARGAVMNYFDPKKAVDTYSSAYRYHYNYKYESLDK